MVELMILFQKQLPASLLTWKPVCLYHQNRMLSVCLGHDNSIQQYLSICYHVWGVDGSWFVRICTAFSVPVGVVLVVRLHAAIGCVDCSREERRGATVEHRQRYSVKEVLNHSVALLLRLSHVIRRSKFLKKWTADRPSEA